MSQRIRRNPPRLGLDIGRVTIDGQPEDLSRDDGSFLKVPAVPLVMQCVHRLVERRYGPEGVWLVSQCRRDQARRNVRMWLEGHDFFGRTGITREQVIFCDTNAEKAGIAQRLKLTDFIDDSLEVLRGMSFVPNRVLFRPNPSEVRRFGGVIPEGIRVVERGWRNVCQALAHTRNAY